MKILYLHGFASSPSSAKATFFANKLSDNYHIDIPDLNGDSFSNLKISDVIKELKYNYVDEDDLIIIGSSMGGLIALNLAESLPNVKKLILLAPAIQINSLWSNIIGDSGLRAWYEKGILPIYHHGKKQEVNLHYKFISDLQSVMDNGFNRDIDTIIFHGLNDATIPYTVSESYHNDHGKSKLYLLESDHSLEDSLEYIFGEVIKFL